MMQIRINTASRMESTGEGGKIHISHSSYQLLLLQQDGESFVIEDRGEREIKGKGRMHTYWLSEKPVTHQRI
ncbi:hypothetical protein BV898_05490 [Hypsibius exemplaris]|uniref:Guanylate cyclase domain-containing protein n=1 Tax=Hypsibius exemplaris TaxID=2072580 RepID=A0A1W0WZ10_HYPEX|nr:hypothetical protein BV898_05490 [Hypsibius exemplaris]